MKITTDKEFSKLMPPLTEAEYKQLEENIVRDGCLAPLSLWRGTLIDGHNCYKICQKHKIKFKTVNVKADSRDDAKVWIIRKHLGRRNLTDFQKIEMVAHLEEVYVAKGKKNMSEGGSKKGLPVLANLDPRKEMASLAGVSTGQYYKGKEIITKATEAEKETIRRKGSGTTMNRVYADIKQRVRKAAALKLAKARRHDKSSIGIGIDLRLGDCLKILPTIPSNSVHFVLVDPFFNVGLKYNSNDDNMPDEDYYLWCKQWLTECCRVLKDRHYGVIFTGDQKLYYVQRAIMESGLTFCHFLKWHKGDNCQSSHRGSKLFYRTELAFLVAKGRPDIYLINRPKFYQDTIFLEDTTSTQADLVDHPARRPVELYKKIIDGFTQASDTVLDPMMGSGSSGCATKELGRRYIGIEIDKHYFNMAQGRINSTKEGGGR